MTHIIISYPDDEHANGVEWAARYYGVDTRLVSLSDFPTLLNLSARIDQHQATFSVREPESPALIRDASVVWNRRSSSFFAPDAAHPADRAAICGQGMRFYRMFRAELFPNASWLNTPAAQAVADNKLHQLRVAVEVGFEIPMTLASNDPQEIRAFVGELERLGRRVVTKPLEQLNWYGDDYVAAAFTAEIDLARCERDGPLQLMPMLYQECIAKARELRVVVLGATVVAYEINSQEVPGASIDWRASQGDPKMRFQKIDLPVEYESKLIDFNRRLGLVFGVFDIIVDRSGNLIFLEVNEQGQFLFLEERYPEFPLLDAFTQFFCDGSPEFIYKAPGEPKRWAEFERYEQKAGLMQIRRRLHREQPEFVGHREL